MEVENVSIELNLQLYLRRMDRWVREKNTEDERKLYSSPLDSSQNAIRKYIKIIIITSTHLADCHRCPCHERRTSDDLCVL